MDDLDGLLEIEESLSLAGEWVKQADVLVIADDGDVDLAATLEGRQWPGVEGLGLKLEEVHSASLFASEPRRAWAYWLHCARACRELRPCPLQSLARDCSSLAPICGHVVTTSIDGSWVRDGWPQDRVVELHGSLRQLQCSEACSDEVWDMPRDLGLDETPASHIVMGPLPKCPRCGAVSRPFVWMGEDDKAFVGARARHAPAQEHAMWERLSRCRSLGASLLCLELSSGGGGSVPASWARMEDRVAALSGRLVRAAMGSHPPSQHLQSLLGRGDGLVLPVRALQALQRCSAVLGAQERASFVLADADTHGAEVSMPSGTSIERLVWKASSEFHDDVTWEPEELYASVQNIEDMRVTRRLARDESVPREFFLSLREDQPRAAILEVRGIRFPARNGRLCDRLHSTRGVLSEMNFYFGSNEYQAKLAQVKHQLELRNMIKEVHLAVLPKYGFFLTPETDLATTWRQQMKMQHSNSFSAVVEPDILNMVSISLQLSGMAKMHTLPTVFQARAKKVETVRRAPPLDSKQFSPEHPRLKLFFGGWFGEERALSAFLEAPSEVVTTYLRDDPDGPFFQRVDAWPEGREPPEDSRWHRWGFQRDTKEFILKADWHSVPHLGPTADLFVPRWGRKGKLRRAPTRYLAFAEAFRAANQPCWSAMVKSLQDLKRAREDETLKASLAALEAGQAPPAERSGGDLIGSIIRALVAQRHFGVFEAQVWWGEGPLKLPSHKDGATSLLHLGITLGGRRSIRVGAFRAPDANGPEGRWWEAGGKEDVWDEMAWLASGANERLRDVEMTRGSAYLSSPYVFEHGVEYQKGTWEEPVIALQCRLAFDAEPGKELNGLRDGVMRDVSNAIAKALCQASAAGDLRMPGLEEILEAETRVSGILNAEPAPRAAGG